MERNSDRIDWHTLDVVETLKQQETDHKGLNKQQVADRQKRYGINQLPQPARQGWLVRFLKQFHNVLIYVLLIAAAITALLNHWVDTSVIVAVVVINALVGVLQEGKAERALDAIRKMLALQATVIREGKRSTLSAEELVPGDLVLLEAGDKVPADVRLIKAHNLSAQEAILTGESMPVDKQIEPVEVNVALGDRSCMAFSGTTVTSGQGQGIVIATASKTEIGRISGMLAQVKTLTTPLVEQMDTFAKWLSLVIVVIALTIFVTGYWLLDYEFSELFMAVVGLTVAAIPEGLPAVLTITLAVGVQAMAKRNAIVRQLPAIETLGSISVICTDKTGTLTRNEMSVVNLATYQSDYDIGGDGYAPEGEITENKIKITKEQQQALTMMGLTALLCNDSELKQEEGQWLAEGDPMEAALLAFVAKLGLDLERERKQWSRTDVIPFDANHRYMATLNYNTDDEATIFVKGAPEKIIQLCGLQQVESGATEKIERELWQQKADTLASQGQRVLALAMKKSESNQRELSHKDVEEDLVLIGLVGLMDPPRSEVIEAVAECYRAGIEVKMITGDHALTASAIGKKIGLKDTEKVLTGADLDELNDSQLAKAVNEVNIFARTSPEHKLRLVSALQADGLVVAMTGDGVNDAPALKRADAGIAMGVKGSEAAKEASSIVLADDNFVSIVAAIREGRTVYDNTKKVISWSLPTSTGEAFTIIVALMLSMALPITAVQILWVNMITAVTLGIALAFEPTENNTMKQSPRPRNQPLLTGTLLWHIIFITILFGLGVFGIYRYAIEQGYSIELARTMAMNTLVIMEIFHLFFIRNMYGTSLTLQAIKGTKVIWYAVILVTVGQLAITYLPWMQSVFLTEAVAIKDGIIIVFIGIALFALAETEKQIRLAIKRNKRKHREHTL
ncbi:cation-transporting P-type ATPase [Kangiella sp.]|uniref:cation-transporting P-type ATPase n=1 Tax=Kangiella sp. TaxID=1920245 RepID=UPI0019A9100E|nr:cation-transporting P-type ATPase [Kangiella sp.]MBD3653201.1 cation-transporting P-type ATPase [Kangiella sp.]